MDVMPEGLMRCGLSTREQPVSSDSAIQRPEYSISIDWKRKALEQSRTKWNSVAIESYE